MAEPVRARRLTEEEGQRLVRIVRRGRHESIRVRRATIILASSSGTPVPAIARLVAADEDTVRDVIHAFNQKGLAALDPQWAGGRPRLISDAARCYRSPPPCRATCPPDRGLPDGRGDAAHGRCQTHRAGADIGRPSGPSCYP